MNEPAFFYNINGACYTICSQKSIVGNARVQSAVSVLHCVCAPRSAALCQSCSCSCPSASRSPSASPSPSARAARGRCRGRVVSLVDGELGQGAQTPPGLHQPARDTLQTAASHADGRARRRPPCARRRERASCRFVSQLALATTRRLAATSARLTHARDWTSTYRAGAETNRSRKEKERRGGEGRRCARVKIVHLFVPSKADYSSHTRIESN